MAQKKDYYELLDVNHDASDDELKISYRKLAMQWHPDRNPDNPKAEEHFKHAKHAYEILSDTNKRAAYDRRAGVAPAAGAGSSNFSDAYGDIFGGGRQRSGADSRQNIEVSLEACATCKGAGAQPATCSTCRGQGQVRMPHGFFSTQKTCPKCHGSGKKIARPCSTCSGPGRVKQHKTPAVKIPAGACIYSQYCPPKVRPTRAAKISTSA